MGARFSRGGRASAPPGFDLRANEATIDVALDKPLYHAGDEILGFVSAEIRRASILSLDVELTCTTQTRVHWTTHSGSGKKRKTHHHWASATHRVLRQRANVWTGSVAPTRAAQESEIPNFKASYLGRFPLVLADLWTSDHPSERSRRVDVFFGTRARGTLTLKRR